MHPFLDIQIGYHNNSVTNIHYTKFLGITIQNNLFWNTHLDHLTTKVSRACYAIRTIKPFMTVNTLITVYHACFHSLLSYGLILWGNSSYSINIFRLQKKAIRIISGISNRDSCRDYFKKLKILPLQSQYLLSTLLFVANSIHLLKSNSEVYINNTRHSFDLYLPSPRLTTYQKGTFYMGIRHFNNLPFEIKALVNNVKLYKIALKIFSISIQSINYRNILT